MALRPGGVERHFAEGRCRGGRGWHPMGFAQTRQRIRVRGEARIEVEDVNRVSCCVPVWLRWRAEQELRGGEPFDDAHGCAADRTVPE